MSFAPLFIRRKTPTAVLLLAVSYLLMAIDCWLLAVFYAAAPCGEMSSSATVPAVLRLCGVLRGIISMSPLLSV
jgi:threonine/homoserine/homoserine lactone efflux protein